MHSKIRLKSCLSLSIACLIKFYIIDINFLESLCPNITLKFTSVGIMCQGLPLDQKKHKISTCSSTSAIIVVHTVSTVLAPVSWRFCASSTPAVVSGSE